MRLSFLVKNFKDEGDGAKNIDKKEHKELLSMGMFSIDGTKVR